MSNSEQVKQAIYSIAKVFLATILANLIAFGDGVLDVRIGDWKAIVAPAVAAVLVVCYNLLDPTDKRYGKGV